MFFFVHSGIGTNTATKHWLRCDPKKEMRIDAPGTPQKALVESEAFRARLMPALRGTDAGCTVPRRSFCFTSRRLARLDHFVVRHSARIHQQQHRLFACGSERLLVLRDVMDGLMVHFLDYIPTLKPDRRSRA
jgi:hypothetical protein